MSSWGASDHYPSGRASPPRDERRRDSRYGEPNYGSYEDNVRDWEEQERLRQWDEYERARSEWERRVNEYKSGDSHRHGSYNSLKRPRSPSPYERDARPRRDTYDGYSRGGRGRYDDGRRSPRRRYSPDSRYRREPALPHPMDQDRLVPYRSFLEWYRETDPDRYYSDEAATKEDPTDRRVGLKARYDEFRADYNAKQVQSLFEKHHTAAWFLEKYDPTEKYSDLRARVRKQGWHGALDHFLDELETGKFDHLFEIAKNTLSTTGSVEKAASQNGETQTTVTTNNSEEKKQDKNMKTEDEEEKVDDDVEWGNPNGDTDEVVIPHKGHQVMIKTIPPDIGRLRLEPVVDKLDGVVSLAVGEPVARRNYYRSAWIEFNTEREAREAMDKLAGQEVDNFRLQVTMIRSPLIARIKRTSVLVSAEKRLAEDLEIMKRMVDMLEKETDLLANYKPLAERTAQDTEGDIKMESPLKENGANHEDHVHRGSAALQARLDKMMPPVDEETDESRLQRLTVSVDLYLSYLRSAFYCCYYCAVIADRADELQRKCVKHVRTPFNEKEMHDVIRSQKRSDREEHWFLLHDEKIETLVDRDSVDPTRFGGKNYERELQTHLREHFKEEDEGKYRCLTCTKMFKNAGYVCKHVANKHSELVGEKFTYETQIYNNFALDPHRIQMPPANPLPPGSGRHARDASRRDINSGSKRGTLDSTDPPRKRTPPPDAKIDPRAGQRTVTYQDLDEVAEMFKAGSIHDLHHIQISMDVFKVPKVPPTTLKRKLSDSISPENAKRHKPSPMAFMQSAQSTSLRVKRAPTVTVEDAPDEDDRTASEAQEEFAPGNDADYFVEEDEDGRFFGGGLTKEQKDILNIFEDAGGEGPIGDLEELSLPAIRRLILKLERAIDKNQDQRSKYPNDPTKFINSEADLDAVIKSLMPLSQVPALAYPELVKSETISMLIGLLSHENIDIVIDVVELIDELTDEDVGGEEDDEEEEGEESKRDAGMKMLMNALTEHSLLELLVQNFSRFNEEEESDRQGLFHVLGIFENMLALNPDLSGPIVAKTSFLQWLLTRIQAKTHDENRGYAAELLVILLQNSRANRIEFAAQSGMEVTLQVLAQYRKKDPNTADEEEFMENIFDALCSALQEPENKVLFNESEGVDLMLIMMREKLMARSRATKVLDNALSGSAGSKNCEVFVEALGLKALFSAFMGKSKKKKVDVSAPASEETSHTIGIIASLLTSLDSESPERIRLLTKFVEGDYEKVDRLLDIREGVEVRLRAVENEIADEKKEMIQEGEDIGPEMDDLWYLRRLDDGLFTLQTVDYILGWICMDDDGVRNHVSTMLSRRSKSLRNIVDTLKEYRDNVADGDSIEESDATSRRDILIGLLGFLESCI